MFRFLDIENFQSHEKTRIDFDKGVNVIFGLSQAGKTAITRAMRLLIDNRPLGGKFFSDFAGDKGDTKITLGLDGSQDISIIKSIRIDKDGDKKVTKTSYTIGEMEFSSPKDQVPDQVTAALNVSELNIQRQFDPPFLVSSSGGEIAKTINRITRLEEVDDWVSELTSEINTGNRDIGRMEQEVKSLIQEIEIYKDIDETEKVISDLQSSVGMIAKLLVQKNDLDKMLVQFEDVTRELEVLRDFLLAERYVKKAESHQRDIDSFEDMESLIFEYDRLTDIIDLENLGLKDLVSIDGKLKASEFDTMKYDILSRLCGEGSANFSRLEGLGKALLVEKIILKAEKLHEEITVFYDMRGRLRVYEQSLDDEGKKADFLMVAKNKYISMLKEIKKCPTCFSDIDVKHLKAIGASL